MRLNDMLGTEFPFIQGGMANIATGEFAAAVSNAGALGLIGSGGMTSCPAGAAYPALPRVDGQALRRQHHADESGGCGYGGTGGTGEDPRGHYRGG